MTGQASRDGNHNHIKRSNQNKDGNHVTDSNQSEHGNHRNRKRGRKGQQQQNKWKPGTGGKFEPPPRIFDRSLLAKVGILF